MQESWYKAYTAYLKNYYKVKFFVLIVIKFVLFFCFFSIFSDICWGYYPDIFHHKVYTEIWTISSEWVNENHSYHHKLFGFYFFICWLIFYYFPRLTYKDSIEYTRRKELEELLIKKKLREAQEKESKKKSRGVDTLTEQDAIIRKNVKDVEKLLKRYFKLK